MMFKQPGKNYISNDRVMTPPLLAKRLYDCLPAGGDILEPARGTGAFYDLMPTCCRDWCEIDQGRDFFEYSRKVDWIITNPPWSKMRQFLAHSMKLADHVAFLCTLNHLWTSARQRDIRNNGFGLERIIMCNRPDGWPQTGFQHGMFLLSKGYAEDCRITFLD